MTSHNINSKYEPETLASRSPPVADFSSGRWCGRTEAAWTAVTPVPPIGFFQRRHHTEDEKGFEGRREEVRLGTQEDLRREEERSKVYWYLICPNTVTKS